MINQKKECKVYDVSNYRKSTSIWHSPEHLPFLRYKVLSPHQQNAKAKVGSETINRLYHTFGTHFFCE